MYSKIRLRILYISVFLLALTGSHNFLMANANIADPEVASLSGMVMDSKSKETIIGATVTLVDTKNGAYTNKSGFYSVKNITPGKYQIKVSYVGYKNKIEEYTFKKGENRRLDIELEAGDVTTDAIYVVADREAEKRQISVSKVNIPIQQIKEIRIGGESDIFRSLQLLPGILTSSQISSGLYVRGGSPDQNLVLLDGSTVYNPSHLFGFISTFNTDAVKDVELIKGGFPAEYGGRLSSVLNITQKDGNKERVDGLTSIGFISSKIALEGPTSWEGGSWFASARRTYFDLLKSAMPEDPENPLPDFYFYDLNGKITQNFGDNDKVSLSGFMSKDLLEFNNTEQLLKVDLGIGNQLVAGKWTHIFNEEMFSTINASYSKYDNNFNADNSGYKITVGNSITDATLKGSLEWFTSDVITHKFGFEINKYNFDYLSNFTGDTDSTQSGSGGGQTNLSFEDYHYAAYAQINYQMTEQLSMQAGLRGTYYQIAEKFTIDPRLALRYQMNEDIALKASWGIFHQNLKLATQPDFSFFDTWLGTDSSLNISKSMHYIFSVETKPWEGYDLNFDVYYKPMWSVNELNRYALEVDKASDALYEGTANAYGFEVFLQKRIGSIGGWAGYAYGFVESKFDSINGGRTFNPKYDRRHDFKAVAQWYASESWELGASFSLQSGQPFTGQTSRLQVRWPDRNQGRGITVPSDRYGLRLPISHQLNVNVSYKFKMLDLPARIILDVYNVYNRRDIWFRRYDTQEEVTVIEDITLLPVIPTLSFELNFRAK